MTDRQRPASGWDWFTERGDRPTRWDWVATFVTLGVMVVAVLQRGGSTANPGAERLIFTLLAWAPLLVRTWFPVPVLTATVLIESLQLLVMHNQGADIPTAAAVAAYQPVPVATMLAVYTVASKRPQRQGWLAGLLSAAVLGGVALLTQPTSLLGTDLVMTEVILVATGIGVFVRDRHDRRARRERQYADDTRRAVTDERLRIARELHDALAHNLTLINAQAGVADYLMAQDPDAARSALRGIATHTAVAIEDLRATIGLLRQDEIEDPHRPPAGPGTDDGLAPVPRLEALDKLLARFRAAGVHMTCVADGEPGPLTQQTDLAAYRIIQEAVTNAAKYAPDASVEVAMTWTQDALHLRVSNGPAPDPTRPPVARGTGHGLIGMRERARAAGGSLDCGATDSGGFAVIATLPLKPVQPGKDS